MHGRDERCRGVVIRLMTKFLMWPWKKMEVPGYEVNPSPRCGRVEAEELNPLDDFQRTPRDFQFLDLILPCLHYNSNLKLLNFSEMHLFV